MRRIKFIILAIPFLLMACKPTTPINNDTCLPEGWEPLQRDVIRSYFMLDKDTLKYVSEEGGELYFYHNEDTYVNETYINTFCKDNDEEEKEGSEGEESEEIPYESYSIANRYQNSDQKTLTLDFMLHQRIDFSCICIYSEPGNNITTHNKMLGYFMVELENDDKKSQGLGWPKNPNEYKSYLTATIQLKDDNGIIVGELVSGRGLVWFTDSSGKRWDLR